MSMMQSANTIRQMSGGHSRGRYSSMGSMGSYKERWQCLAISITFLIGGIVLIVIGAVNYRETKKEYSHRLRDRIGVVVDAGGSGTRLLIYSFSNGTINQLYYNSCEDEGMAKYSEEEFPQLKEHLAECINLGVRNQNLPSGNKVPIYYGATAGMRLLRYRNMTMYNKLWDLVREVIDESPLKAEKTDTITGFEEAKWALVAANYLKKRLKEGKDLYGTVEFGSSSVQIAIPKPDVNIDGKNLSIYGHSYLCFGRNEMERHYLAMITKLANYTKVVKNPCQFRGYNKTVKSDYLWQVPCVSGDFAKKTFGEDINGPEGEFTMEGAGNYSECAAQINRMINVKCTKSSCGMNDVYQPPVHGTFLALAVFFYAADFMGISATAGKEEFLEATRTLCGKTWDELKKEGKTEPVKHTHTRCFDSSYAYFLLTKAFKFNDDTWHIEFTKKINGQEAQWTLGLMYTYQKSMYERFSDTLYHIIVEKPAFIVAQVIGVLLVIAGVVFLSLSCRS